MILLSTAALSLISAVTISNAIPSTTPEIIIQAETEGKHASYKSSVWLQADSQVASLAVLPSDLKDDGLNSERLIPSSSVHITFVPGLDAWVPKEL